MGAYKGTYVLDDDHAITHQSVKDRCIRCNRHLYRSLHRYWHRHLYGRLQRNFLCWSMIVCVIAHPSVKFGSTDILPGGSVQVLEWVFAQALVSAFTQELLCWIVTMMFH